MKAIERAILELLDESGLRLTPGNIAENTGYSGGYVRRECNRLAGLELLEKRAAGTNPFYSITDRGRRYLAGDLELETG